MGRIRMKKVLLVTTVSGFVPQFEMNNVKYLQSIGYEVHYATNYNNPYYDIDNHRLDGTGIIRHQIDFSRSPYSKQTIVAYKQLKKVMSDNQYDLVHCHTPMGAALSRIVAKTTDTKPVIYTAHGFYFYKGAPIRNILIYKTIEKWLAHYTDALITINQEDLAAAQKFKMRENKKIYYIPGVGIDVKRYQDTVVDKKKKREELGVPLDAFVLLSVGELNYNKNQQVVIRALSECNNKKLIYLICGRGPFRNKLEKLKDQLNLKDQIKFLGFRKDIPEIMKASDVFIHPSKWEGLPLSIMEAMACGLPVIASNIRGSSDLISNEINGKCCKPEDINQFVEAIKGLYEKPDICKHMKENNLKKIKDFDVSICTKKMIKIYQEVMSKYA